MHLFILYSAVTRRVGYTDNIKQSLFAMNVLEYMNSERKAEGKPLIKHQGNGDLKEVKLSSGISLDGFCSETGEAISINGCFYHSHGNDDVPICMYNHVFCYFF